MTKYHFTGIKGSGMSALALILDSMGYQVQGSDVETTYFTQKPLEERGIPILPFNAHNIQEGMCVIAGNAFNDEHIEIKQALETNIPLYRYHQFLGELAQGFTSIAVTGSHGKTSTTGLLAHVLGAIRPTSYLIGDGTGKGQADSDYFVFEACEYRRHFLAYTPDYAIITNIDFDHPDYFSSIDDVQHAFQQFADNVQRKIVVCGDDPYIRKLQGTKSILYYGFSQENELQAEQLVTDQVGVHFNVIYRGEALGQFSIPFFGKHNVLNALAVIGICLLEGLELSLVKEHLQNFQGVKRRFSEKTVDKQVLIDDYAHHPVEIVATIEAVRAKYPSRKLTAVFQPHTYTRTKQFLNEFAASLRLADEVYLCEIFSSARETKSDISIADLLEKIPGSNIIAEDSVQQLAGTEDAVILFMGAGDVPKIQEAYEQFLQGYVI